MKEKYPAERKEKKKKVNHRAHLDAKLPSIMKKTMKNNKSSRGC